MITRMKELLKDEEGATMVGYALMLALIAVVCIAVVTQLGLRASETFKQSMEKMPEPPQQ